MEPREGMTNGCRVLLLRLASPDFPSDGAGRMNQNGVVSIPRTRLAADLGVKPARITEGMNLARELGFLDIVRRARPHVTAVYQALTPTSEVRPAVPQTDVDWGTPTRTSPEVRPAVPQEPGLRYALPPTQEWYPPQASDDPLPVPAQEAQP